MQFRILDHFGVIILETINRQSVTLNEDVIGTTLVNERLKQLCKDLNRFSLTGIISAELVSLCVQILLRTECCQKNTSQKKPKVYTHIVRQSNIHLSTQGMLAAHHAE